MSDSIDVENAQNLVNFLKRLRAVRQFRPDPIPQEIVDTVLDVARWSGSASNKQPWEFVVIRNKETLQCLIEGRRLCFTPCWCIAGNCTCHGG